MQERNYKSYIPTPLLQASLETRISSSLANATSWLAAQLYQLDRQGHPADLAAVAYSLEVARSPAREAAFQLLSKYRQEGEGLMFWGSAGEEDVGTRRDDQGHLLPNPSLCCESLSVRATAQALLTYSLRREFIIEPIARWLNSRRHSATSWSSSWDSAVATQALVAHSLASPGPTTRLAIKVKLQGSRTRQAAFTLSPSEPGPQHLGLTNFHGEVVVEVQGQGTALLQLSSTYTRPTTTALTPPVTAWALEATAELSPNTSEVVVTSCQRWLCPYETGYSGPAVLEVKLPSGFSPPSLLTLHLLGEQGVVGHSVVGGVLRIDFLYVSKPHSPITITSQYSPLSHGSYNWSQSVWVTATNYKENILPSVH